MNAIFGAVDYCRDMRVKLTSEAVEQMWGRAKMAIAARAAGIVAIDAPFVAYQDIPAFECLPLVRNGAFCTCGTRLLVQASKGFSIK